jgi:hypothetical protein
MRVKVKSGFPDPTRLFKQFLMFCGAVLLVATYGLDLSPGF